MTETLFLIISSLVTLSGFCDFGSTAGCVARCHPDFSAALALIMTIK